MRNLFQLIALLAALVLQSQSAEARRVWPAHGASGDVSIQQECPAGEELVGFNGRTGAWIDQIQMVCAPLLADGTHGDPHPFGERYGGYGGAPKSISCERNMHIDKSFIHLTDDDRKVLYVTIACLNQASGEYAILKFSGNGSFKKCTYTYPLFYVPQCESGDSVMHRCPQERFTGFTINFGEHVNALGAICDRRDLPVAVSSQPRHVIVSGRVHPAAPVKIQAPRSSFAGTWDTVTSANGHFRLVLAPQVSGSDEGVAAMQMFPVVGQFTNADGADDYSGALTGSVPPGQRTLRFTFNQKNGGSGSGEFTLSDDGNAISGRIVQSGETYTWTGQRARR